MLPDAVLAASTVDTRTTRWRGILANGDTDVTLAVDGQAIVGFAAACPQRSPELSALGFPGEISALYLLRTAQRAGTGRRLMRAAAGNLLFRGFAAAGIWVLDANASARGFYGRLGGTVVARRADRYPGGDLPVVAYGFDLARLATA
ncbi:MAG: GNAT family N-acetyltransferase [Gluconacetobacter diazotrophicus]|nr:GNAT family N-acetyltransferase [Gluconacetobacter diazotrophicus]